MKWRLYREKLFWLRDCEKGWSQEEAAWECDASDKKQYHLWESGKTLCPRKISLEKIAKAFNLSSYKEIILYPSETPDPKFLTYYYDNFGRSELNSIQEESGNHPYDGYKLVCFDLDGTLLKGFDFSWKVVWDFYGKSGNIKRKEGLKLFHTKQILTRIQLKSIAKKFKLTKNLYSALNLLIANGYSLAIICGGINTFLEDLIPDYSNYFKHVFINRFHFDKNGKITSVTPTPFDFENKSRGVEFICNELNVLPSESVFVGEAFNDKHVIDTVGLSIGFQPKSIEIEELFDHIIYEDDLMLVANKIINEQQKRASNRAT